MSIDLIVEVLDHAPEKLTPSERLVLVVIAEWANDKTRVAKQTKNWNLDTICRRAGIQRSGLKSVLQRLAKNGLEVRVPVRWKDGKPVYAYEGTAVTFKLPVLDVGSGDATATPQRGGHSNPTEPREGATASERGGCGIREGWSQQPPSPHRPLKEQPLTPLPPATDLAVVVGEIVEEEGERFIEERINTLVTDAAQLAADRQWKPAKIRPHVVAALKLVENNLDALAVLVRKTAEDPESRSPSRISNPGNPYLRQVGTALLIARMDAMPEPVVEIPAGAHPFQPGGYDCRCVAPGCDWPEANYRHRDAAGALLRSTDARLKRSA